MKTCIYVLGLHVFTLSYIYVSVRLYFVCVYVRIYVGLCMYVCMHVCMYIYVFKCVCKRMHIYIYIIYACACKNVITYIYVSVYMYFLSLG